MERLFVSVIQMNFARLAGTRGKRPRGCSLTYSSRSLNICVPFSGNCTPYRAILGYDDLLIMRWFPKIRKAR
jgi:hypothetical protein